MSQLKTPLNLDPNFEQWASATAINTSNWTFSGTNATQVQLDRRHPRDHPARAQFPSAQKSSDYIYSGRYSWRGSIDTALGSFTLLSSEFSVSPDMNPAVLLVCRQQAGLSLTARIVLAPTSGGTDNASLNTPNQAAIPNSAPRHFFWDTTATRDLDLGADQGAINYWRHIGLQCPKVSGGGYWMQVRIEVTDVSGTIPAFFDVGEFSVVGQGAVVHGVG
jgi:hypothetical protein